MNGARPTADSGKPAAQRTGLRHRGHLLLALGLVIVAGLGSRAFPFFVPASLGKYPGDAFWAMMVLFGLAFLRPADRPRNLAVLALSLSWLVEFSQLYQAGWIHSIRATRIGHLALGARFDAADLPALAAGVLAGLGLDAFFLYKRPKIRED
jgi:hypothetical protein